MKDKFFALWLVFKVGKLKEKRKKKGSRSGSLNGLFFYLQNNLTPIRIV